MFDHALDALHLLVDGELHQAVVVLLHHHLHPRGWRTGEAAARISANIIDLLNLKTNVQNNEGNKPQKIKQSQYTLHTHNTYC